MLRRQYRGLSVASTEASEPLIGNVTAPELEAELQEMIAEQRARVPLDGDAGAPAEPQDRLPV